MRIARAAMAAGAVAAVVTTVGIANPPSASAWGDAYPVVRPFGTQEELVDAAGTIRQGWTVQDVRPSTDRIPWPVHGRLWESTATVSALRGCPEPIVSDMNARAPDGETYQVLGLVATPQGLNPRTICTPDHSTGRLYFDVIGRDPNSVVYRADGRDLLIWVGGAPPRPAAPPPRPAPPGALPPPVM